MAGKVGRPRKARTVTKEDRLKYFRKRYNFNKRNKKDFGSKEYFKVLITKCVRMDDYTVKRFRPQLRHKLHRWVYMNQAGVILIHENDLMTDTDLCHEVATHVGEGEWIIKGGYAHKQSKRCTWRALYRFKAIARDGDFYPMILKKWDRRIRHYWWFKKRKEFASAI